VIARIGVRLAELPVMVSQSLVEQLVEEALDNDLTPEEVCAEHPELMLEVMERLRRCKEVEAQLEAVFPSTHDVARSESRVLQLAARLPSPPGYEVECILGRGGMGVVYKAKQLKLNRPVALKMLLAGRFAARAEVVRFKREGESVAALRHPNVVQIYDVSEYEGHPYFTMEFVEGGNLAAKLAGAPQPGAQAAAITIALARAVQVAHDAGIVHRDLKPANILLTADGTPKIGDFGLARHFQDESGLTITGSPVGTPSYMAPEQAIGKASAVGPAADIYSLGAILYEMLTGRPPFRGETATDTERQLIFQSPVPPSRLNHRVPRDLETICLKCLAKEPHRRYESAADLAADLEAFQRGEAISARRPNSVERIYRWIRRRPAASALIAASTLFVAVLIGIAGWIAVEDANRRHAIEIDLREIGHLQEEAKWIDAGVVLQRAEARLPKNGVSDLGKRLKQARSDLDLVVALDRIRLNRETNSGELVYYRGRADREYLATFEKSGLARATDRADVVAQRVHASAVRLALIAALDDWAVCAADKGRRLWLLDILSRTDSDPMGWSSRIRAPSSWDDLPTLNKLAETVPVKGESVSLLLALGERLRAAGGDATPFFRRVQENHPADFWSNILLGDSLFSVAPTEAGGYYRAALASRPEAAVAYTALGDALKTQKRPEEALRYYRQALAIDPNYARGYANLGNILRDTKQNKEAIECYRTAIRIDSNYAWAHLGLAYALTDSAQDDEALEHYRQFLATGPAIPHVVNIVRSDLIRHGQGEEVRLEWKKALELDPPNHDAWFGYAELCLFLENESEYLSAKQDLMRRFGNTTNQFVAEKTARALLLGPPSKEELQTAIDLADLAVAAKANTPEWVYPYFLFAQGLAEFRQGHFETAITIMEGDAATIMGPCPRFVTAMAQYHLGDAHEARDTLATALGMANWDLSQVRSHDQWIWHVLRREAEGTIRP
jgi:eukaryotic-like serine/threonine-protein kinase